MISFLSLFLIFTNVLAIPNNHDNRTLTRRSTDLKKPKSSDKLSLCQTAPPGSSTIEEGATACCKTVDKKNTKATGCRWIPRKEFLDWNNGKWVKNTAPIKKLCPHADEKELRKGLKGKRVNLLCITTGRVGKNAKVGNILRRISRDVVY